ncbi:MAG: rRNA methyltransferase, partial [Dermabacter sp.]|nr:rRNA methyltransferase [Dermabacter sp.]
MGAGVALVVGVKVVVMVENREAAEAVPAEAAVAEAVEGTEQGTARFEVGVGPWEGPWPEGDHWDEELLREGDRR